MIHEQSDEYVVIYLILYMFNVTWDSQMSVTEVNSIMMTPSKWNIFRGEFTGHRSIPLTKASDAELDLRLNKRLSKQCHRVHYDVTIMITLGVRVTDAHWLNWDIFLISR